MIKNQAYLFLIFTLNGFLIGIIFDFFRIMRKSFSTTNILTYIEDTIFWIIAGAITLYNIITFNNGEIRFFMLAGIIIGFVTYVLLISIYVTSINITIINKLKNMTKKLIKTLKKTSKKGGI